MSVYLRDIPLREAQAIFQKALEKAGWWGTFETEEIALDEYCLNRVLAKPIWAKISSPHYHASAMDGFAVRAEETQGATQGKPVLLAVPSQAGYVDTGDPLPGWANAVVPIEASEAMDETGMVSVETRHPAAIRIRNSVTPWQHVRPMGEDIVATQLVLPAGRLLRAVDLGAIAACGHTQIKVVRKPKVAVIPSGSELVAPGSPIKPGDIIEYNSLVLAAQINSWGGEAVRFPIVVDNLDTIILALHTAIQRCDFILLNAGSSAGSEDFSFQAIERLGEVLVHGVAVRPGHPVILGLLNRPGLPDGAAKIGVIGVPGFPVSAALTNEIFVKPLIRRWLSRPEGEEPVVRASITKKITSPLGDDDYIRVVVGKVGERICAAPLSRGAGVITSLVQADGLVILPSGTQGLQAGDVVSVHLFAQPEDITRTLFSIGSHDISLDLLAQYLGLSNYRLVSSNVGSLGGLLAIKRGETHLAGSHLLDPESGEYNVPFIHQYLPGREIYLVGMVYRQQGLIIPRGNPLKVQGLRDLIRPEISFVNRQPGAGTRVLLDYNLKALGIASEQIQGYNHQEFTHLTVAAAIASGRAACGLGIAAAAQALGLDFLPLFKERYDLVIPAEFFDTPAIIATLKILNDPAYQKAVQDLPGYDVTGMGTILERIKS